MKLRSYSEYDPDRTRRDSYKDLMEDSCACPTCEFGQPVEVHHIIPRLRRGPDRWSNYICLCRHCHRRNSLKLHARWEQNIETLYRWKIAHQHRILDGWDLRNSIVPTAPKPVTIDDIMYDIIKSHPGMSAEDVNRIYDKLEALKAIAEEIYGLMSHVH